MHAAIDAAFAAVARVHRLMSFQESTSDVSRVNRHAATTAVEVHPWTYAVLTTAGWDKVVDLNLKAPFDLTRRMLELMRSAATAADPARVIMIGSVDGLRTGASFRTA